jgi:serine/threonine protein kinase
MLCGILPFDDENRQNIYKKILKYEIKYPDNLTDNAIDLMKKILILNPKKRITIEDIKKHRFYLIGKEEFNKKNP